MSKINSLSPNFNTVFEAWLLRGLLIISIFLYLVVFLAYMLHLIFHGLHFLHFTKTQDLNADEEYYNQLIFEELNKVNWREFEDEFATDED